MKRYFTYLPKNSSSFLLAMLLPFLLAGCISNEERAQTALVKDLEWIKGKWDGTGQMQRHEEWKQISGQSMNGQGLLIEEGDTLTTAVMQIDKPEDHVQYAIRTKDATEPAVLKLQSLGDKKAVFVNENEGNPRSVTYHKQGNTMKVVIEGDNGEKTFEMNGGK